MDPVQMLERAAAQLRSLEGVWARGPGAPGKGGQLDPVIWRDLEEAAAVLTPAPAPVPPPVAKARPTAVAAPGAFPPVDVFVTEAMVVVNAAIPGVERPGELRVTLIGDSRLRLSGMVPAHPLQGRAAGGGLLEQMHGAFDRTVPLPVPVRGDTAQSFYHNGLLEVWLARQSEGEQTVKVGI